MASVMKPISACFKKNGESEVNEDKSKNAENISDNHEKSTEVENPGLIWRMSSSLYNLGSGAVGLGVGSVKWAASTTLPVVSGVVSATQSVVAKVVPSVAPKPKKE